MIKKPIKVLLIEDNNFDAQLIKDMLFESEDSQFNLKHSENLSTGLTNLRKGNFDIILLDLNVPDSFGLETLHRVIEQESEVPVVICSAIDDKETALLAVKEGAQDYLIKGQINETLLTRSIFYAIERKLIEEKLKRSEEKYRDLFENANDLIQSVAPDGSFLYVNRSWREILGYSEKEVPNIKLFEIVHPDSMEDCRATFKRIISGGKGEVVEVVFISRGGNPVVVEGNVNCSFENGNPVSTRGIFRDITQRKEYEAALRKANEELEQRVIERTKELESINEKLNIEIVERRRSEELLKESEERLELALSVTQLGSIYWDLEENEIIHNKHLLDILGYTDKDYKEISTDKNLWDKHTHPEDKNKLIEVFIEHMEGHIPFYELEHRFRTKNGEWRWALARGKIVKRDKEGNPLRVSGTLLDITERKNAEKTLQNSEARLNEAQRIAHIGSWDWDLLTNEVTWSDEMYRIFGMSPDNFTPTPEELFKYALQHINPDDADSIIESINNAAENKVKYNIEYRTLNSGGITQHIHVLGNVIYDSNDNPIRIVGTVQDITERKKIEKQLQESEKKWRLLYENLPGGSVVINSEYLIEDVNDVLCATTGFTREELIGQECDIICPKGPHRCPIFDMGKEQIDNDETTVKTKIGNTVPIIKSSRKISMGDKVVVVENFQDITEMKATEEKYRLVVENANEAIVVAQEGIMKFVNPKTSEILGYSEDELVSRAFIDFVHSDDQEIVLKAYTDWLDGRISYPIAFRIITKDGAVKWFHINAANITWEGKPASLAFLSDITKRRKIEEALIESEEKFRNFFETSKDVIFISTIDGKFGDINPAAEELFGYTSEELRKLDISDLYANREVRRVGLELLQERGFLQDMEVPFKKKDGIIIDCLITASLRKDKNGNIIGYQGIIKDITDKKILEEQLFRAQKMEAIGTLSGGIAHDFNNILATILGYSSFLKNRIKKEEPFYEEIDAIEKSAVRASNLTSQLLAYSRKGKLQVKPINMNWVVKEVYNLISKTFEKSINIKLNTDRNLKTVEGDESQLNQVVMNIAVNAQNAMLKGGTLKIETHMKKIEESIEKRYFNILPGNYVCIKFTDTGIGMNEETMNQIFEPYFTTRGDKGGSGLGMSVVFGIVKGHGGYIDVKSTPGKGTEIIVYFPASMKSEELLEKEIERGTGGTETLLIIDDEEAILKMSKTILEESGFNVYTTSSGKNGLRTFKEKNIDLVILDIKMPGMDGKEVLEKLMEIDPKVKILLSSGYSEEDEHHDLIRMGAKGFIGKPFVVDKLLMKIHEVLA